MGQLVLAGICYLAHILFVRIKIQATCSVHIRILFTATGPTATIVLLFAKN